MKTENLCIVMPVYNEQDAIDSVVDEWQLALKAELAENFHFVIVDDGSTDKTPERLQKLGVKYPQLELITKKNQGHGQACVTGYRMAVDRKYDWILQIDSDGQCDPKYIRKLWEAREKHPIVYGYRFRREDGWTRWLISRFLAAFLFFLKGSWVKDPNSPYRLMRAKELQQILPQIPPTFYLANILVSLLLNRNFGIRWVSIIFRKRIGGQKKASLGFFWSSATRLWRDLSAWSSR